MSNRLRTEVQEENAEAEVTMEESSPKEIPENWFTTFLSKSIVSPETAGNALPFVIFLAFLGMLYIGNMHMAENNIRDIDKLNKEVQELGWDYKTAKADLTFKSTLTEVVARADSLGLKEQLMPPQKLMVREDDK